MNQRLKIGVSSCLLGERVRYDGELKRSALIADDMAHFFDFIPVCPEVEAGFPVPRPPVQLVGDQLAPRVVEVGNSQIDITERLDTFSRQRVVELEGVCGYLFKARSPSCGPDIPLFDLSGREVGRTKGIFSRSVQHHFPLLPVEDEGGMENSANGGWFLFGVLLFACWQGTDVGDESDLSPAELWRSWVDALYPGVQWSPQIVSMLGSQWKRPEEAGQLLRGAGRGGVV
ncbi:MAG: DUF523 domain-containing protein [Candidatus Sedimenticola sp. (ex Thyasira tokunagai)]